ncbi:NADH-dependent flavin oxidoreductase [Crassaminicella profunda]|uniref:NADH-dependent flavin oxidoreductase n=1 Tax=Crassaminicella profunda TaxID=1286698 RepID=UPI001CA638FB|nr:NADH-dependent flavin oxidoreductase [Crassaminicella profunda]QZY56896.1 NADH-dependent flavin oxidoreductase [Crassaminicella profunda]
MFNEFILKENVKLRNKIVLAPLTTWSSNDNLTISDEEVDYYIARSKEAGMVITGCTFFQPNGQAFENEFYAGSDEFIPSLKKLSNSIKSQGAKAILQIFHGGRMALPNNGQLISASAVKSMYNVFGMEAEMETPKEMTHEEIQEFIHDFYETTRRAIEAGFDGIEIHGSNKFLIQQFFSAETNRRTDEWGGTSEKRLRFPLEIIKAANKARTQYSNTKFIIGYRFSPEEMEEKGITLEDTLYLVDKLADQEIDYMHVSLMHYKATSIRNPSDKRIIGKLLLEKVNGRKPIIGVGSIYSKADVEDALNNVGYNLVSIGQAIVTDPNWIRKIKASEEIQNYIDMENLEKQNIPIRMANKIASFPGWFKIKRSE